MDVVLIREQRSPRGHRRAQGCNPRRGHCPRESVQGGTLLSRGADRGRREWGRSTAPHDERLDRWWRSRSSRRTCGRTRSTASGCGGRAPAPASPIRRSSRSSTCCSPSEADAIVVELVEGCPSPRSCTTARSTSAPRSSVGREIADALTEAPSHGIVHRDLKTENVVFTPAGHPKILDFEDRQAARPVRRLVDPGRSGSSAPAAPWRPSRPRARDRSPRRPVRPRHPALRGAHRPVTVPRPECRRHSPQGLHAPAAAGACAQPLDPGRAVGPDRPAPGEGAGLLAAQRARGGGAAGADRRRGPALLSGDTTSGTYGDEATLVELPASPMPAHPMAAHRPLPMPPPRPRRSASRLRPCRWPNGARCTVLLCGSVHPDGAPLDPEEMLDGMRELHNAMTEIIERFDGLLGPARTSAGWPGSAIHGRARTMPAGRSAPPYTSSSRRAPAAQWTGRDLAWLRAPASTPASMIMAPRTGSRRRCPGARRDPQWPP